MNGPIRVVHSNKEYEAQFSPNSEDDFSVFLVTDMTPKARRFHATLALGFSFMSAK